MKKNLESYKKSVDLHHNKSEQHSNFCKRGVSSAGSEHLPYKQGVTGSNPVLPIFF